MFDTFCLFFHLHLYFLSFPFLIYFLCRSLVLQRILVAGVRMCCACRIQHNEWHGIAWSTASQHLVARLCDSVFGHRACISQFKEEEPARGRLVLGDDR